MKINNEHIDELLIAYLLGELDPDTRQNMEQWLASSDTNRKKLQQVEKVWKASETANIDFDTEKAWGQVSKKMNQQSFFLRNWIGIAASVIVLLTLSGAYFFLNQPDKTTVIYANSELQADTLPDGSTIKLNEGTQITYLSDFNEKTRTLQLSGEAFFKVKKNSQKAFIVHTPNSRIEVLGTSFNISASPTDSLVTVSVASGKVRFSYLPKSGGTYHNHYLTKGERVVYNKHTRKVVKSTGNSQVDTYWANKNLSFDNTPLSKVVQLLEEIFGAKIVLTNPKLNNCRVTAGFDNNTLDEILTVVASTFGLELHKNNSTYSLNGKACEDR